MFTVVAGEYEADGSRNYKYLENFDTRRGAEAAFVQVKGYPFAEIEVAPQALLQEAMDRALSTMELLNRRYDWHRQGKDHEALDALTRGVRALLEAEEIQF